MQDSTRRPRRSDPWKAAFVTILVVSLLAVVSWVLLGSRLLVVRDVEVTGIQRLSPEKVVEAVSVATGTPLVRVDTERVQKRAQELRLVESAEVYRSWPTTLRVEVTERTAELAIKVGDGYQLVDRFGVLVTDSSKLPEGYPLVDIKGEVAGNPAIKEAAAIVEGLSDSTVDRLKRIEAADPDQITLILAEGAEVVWGDGERMDEKARVLEVLMEQHPPTGDRHYDVSAPGVAVVV